MTSSAAGSRRLRRRHDLFDWLVIAAPIAHDLLRLAIELHRHAC